VRAESSSSTCDQESLPPDQWVWPSQTSSFVLVRKVFSVTFPLILLFVRPGLIIIIRLKQSVKQSCHQLFFSHGFSVFWACHHLKLLHHLNCRLLVPTLVESCSFCWKTVQLKGSFVHTVASCTLSTAICWLCETNQLVRVLKIKLFLLKGSFVHAVVHAQDRGLDQRYVGFYLARLLFLNWRRMNLTNLGFNESDWIWLCYDELAWIKLHLWSALRWHLLWFVTN